MGFYLIRVDIIWQRQDAGKTPATALLAMPDRFVLDTGLSLALEHDLVAAGHIDLEVFLINAGQLALDVNCFDVFPHINRREGMAGPPGRPSLPCPAVEHAIHFVLESLQLRPQRTSWPRIPDGRKHTS